MPLQQRRPGQTGAAQKETPDVAETNDLIARVKPIPVALPARAGKSIADFPLADDFLGKAGCSFDFGDGN
jgi:hypothetical protein